MLGSARARRACAARENSNIPKEVRNPAQPRGRRV
jgi:hypothetical protein